MHDHDLDLIADHLDTPSDQARRLIGSCPDCAAEHRLHTEIRDRLANLGGVRMTADESARLHSRIDTALDAKVVVLPTAGWLKLASVAAGLVVVVGLGRFFVQDRGTGEETASTMAAATRVLSADEGSPAPANTLAADGFEAFSAEATHRVLVGEATLQDVADLLAQSDEDFADRSTEKREDLEYASQPACSQFLETPVSRVVEATVDGRPLVAYLTSGAKPPITIAYYADTCEPVDLPS